MEGGKEDVAQMLEGLIEDEETPTPKAIHGEIRETHLSAEVWEGLLREYEDHWSGDEYSHYRFRLTERILQALRDRTETDYIRVLQDAVRAEHEFSKERIQDEYGKASRVAEDLVRQFERDFLIGWRYAYRLEKEIEKEQLDVFLGEYQAGSKELVDLLNFIEEHFNRKDVTDTLQSEHKGVPNLYEDLDEWLKKNYEVLYQKVENLVENHPKIEKIGEGKIVASLLRYAFTKKMLMGDRETWLACGLKHHYEKGSYPSAFERLLPSQKASSFYWARLNEHAADNIEWGEADIAKDFSSNQLQEKKDKN
ncbi:MAG: hypothetical protein R6U96_01300 [Promethearchaeia archaeon]